MPYTAAQIRYNQTPKGKATALRRNRRRRTIPAGIVAQLRNRARHTGLEFSLRKEDIEELLAPLRCSLTGLPLQWRPNEPRYLLSPSIDRIDNDRGYTRDNVQCVALWVNLARNGAPLEEFQAVLQQLYEVHDAAR